MELLEREHILASLREAYASAARGAGRAVVVLGEPGIGKTTVVERFLEELGPDAHALRGTCDDLATPRPLGPLRDMAATTSAALSAALSEGGDLHHVHGLLLDEVAAAPSPTVVLIEDIHWADDATLDAVTVLIRRIGSLPTLLLLTCRDGEAPPGHPIRYAVGSARPGEVTYVTLAPLSRAAVATLAGARADAIHDATGGNPLFVRELLAAPGDELPPTIANAVLARTARLPHDAQRLLALVSLVPNRTPTSLLDALLPDWPEAAVEPERRGLLEVDSRHLRFRHEVSRNALRASLPLAEQRRLHATILEALLEAGADPAEIVHHAEGAGDERVTAVHALVAARRAAAVGANREAYAHYRRAAALADGRPPREQAVVLEEAAGAAQLAGRVEDAFPLADRAIALFRELDDVESVGRCTRKLARFHWFAGDSETARAEIRRAIELLEPLGESEELGRAYAGLSALTMLAPSFDEALLWGGRALDLATRLGDEQTRAHALVNLGTTRCQLEPRLTQVLLDAHAAADAAGDPHEAARALGNLAGNLRYWGDGSGALRYAEQALHYAERHEVLNIAHYLSLMIAELHARQGAWDEAELTARADLE
ncbi:MAG: AAA family ATPase, partial [Gaiella sp.]